MAKPPEDQDEMEEEKVEEEVIEQLHHEVVDTSAGPFRKEKL